MGGFGSGGARVQSGPAADPDSIRSAKGQGGDWESLPGVGRQGKAPEWPLDPEASDRELQLWVRLWARPQALMWERMALFDEVAHYVRVFTEAEQREAATPLRTLRRQLAEQLGLTLPAMNRLRWQIVHLPAQQLEPTGTDEAPAPVAQRRRTRDRFGVVPAGD